MISTGSSDLSFVAIHERTSFNCLDSGLIWKPLRPPKELDMLLQALITAKEPDVGYTNLNWRLVLWALRGQPLTPMSPLIIIVFAGVHFCGGTKLDS